MIRYRKKTRSLINHTLLLAFLFLLFVPVISVRATGQGTAGAPSTTTDDSSKPGTGDQTTTTDPDKSEAGDQTTPGDQTPPDKHDIQTKVPVDYLFEHDAPITITYYDSYGTRIAQDKSPKVDKGEEYTITVKGYYDPKSGGNYENYQITSYSAGTSSMKISLKGISPENASAAHKLTELIITQAPTKTSYAVGESFDKSGMVVNAYYDDNRYRKVTNYTISPSGALSADTQYVTISLTEGEGENKRTKSVNQYITVGTNNNSNNNNNNNSNSCVITASATAGGTISDSGSQSINRGGNKTYTIRPNNGHKINYVEVDGSNVGAVSSYTFSNVQGNHSITAHFQTGTPDSTNDGSQKMLTIIGSFAPLSGTGSYAPGTPVTVNAGLVPGFDFAGWVASDGIVYPLPVFSFAMPSHDLVLYANWTQPGVPNPLNYVTTTNLKETQLTGWTKITAKLATFGINDLDPAVSPVLKITASGISCYVDAATIAALNARQGLGIEISYGEDASFSFFSDADNSQFTGTDFSYVCTPGSNMMFHEKNLTFTNPGEIHTGICINVLLPDALTGQAAYVYLVNADGTETLYISAIVDSDKKISIPISTKTSLSIKY